MTTLQICGDWAIAPIREAHGLAPDLTRVFDRLELGIRSLQEAMLRLPDPGRLGHADPAGVESEQFQLLRVRLEVALAEAVEAASRLGVACGRIASAN